VIILNIYRSCFDRCVSYCDPWRRSRGDKLAKTKSKVTTIYMRTLFRDLNVSDAILGSSDVNLGGVGKKPDLMVKE
jgi:hypothetical protein